MQPNEKSATLSAEIIIVAMERLCQMYGAERREKVLILLCLNNVQ
jgi:Tfp pilus assembly ATPase PilU